MSYTAVALLETGGALLLAGIGAALGVCFSRMKGRAWVLGYLAPLAVLILIVIGRRIPQLELLPPFRWVMAGRVEFAFLAFICTMVLTTPLYRLPDRRRKVQVAVLMTLASLYLGVLPFLMPAFEYGTLSRLETRLDRDGVCLQRTGYTCGPAAAVTVLRRMGIPAEEGELALEAHTSHFTGTPPDVLCAAIDRRYSVRCRPTFPRSLEETRGKEPYIAAMKYEFMVDHYVAVLSVTDTEVVVGDPLSGLKRVSHQAFARQWRHTAIVFDAPPRNDMAPRADAAPHDQGAGPAGEHIDLAHPLVRRKDTPLPRNTVPAIHVIVALCDNVHQGIVPVDPMLGNGDDPANNLYWGALYGVKTHLKKSPHWTLKDSATPSNTAILERIVFTHAPTGTALVADAYKGSEIRVAVTDFLRAAAGHDGRAVALGDGHLGIAGAARLVAYVGHNGLMDFNVPCPPRRDGSDAKPAIVLACASKPYFEAHLTTLKCTPLLLTTGLMAPEAYTLDAALHAYLSNEPAATVRERAAAAYNTYQKCGMKAARNLFSN